jgi:mRNA-degrading endonuclease HigB of HigAB toxin-antitoxin module
MKRYLYFLIVLAMVHVSVVAQQEKPVVPAWAPASGYWVAENNVKQPMNYTLYFYTDDHVLIYKENLEGVKLNLNSARVKKRLKKVLEKSLLAWQEYHKAKENEGLVINLLQRK